MKYYITIILLASCTLLTAQTLDTTRNTGALKEQFETIMAKSKTSNGFKVIRQTRLTDFYKNLTDSIKRERSETRQAKAQVKELTQQVNNLQADLKKKDVTIEQTNDEVDEINLLGLISLSKGNYKTLMWGLIISLALALGITVYQSGAYRREAKYRIKLFEELTEEFHVYKTKSIEKEKKLARELQTERNRLEELQNKDNN